MGQGPGQSLYTDKPVKILLVENNLADVVFFRETLRDIPLPVTLQVVEKGDEALADLRYESKCAHAFTPDTISPALFLHTLLSLFCI